jgi:hypothetical protein
MANLKHTPEPWGIAENHKNEEKDNFFQYSILGGMTKAVAEVWRQNFKEVGLNKFKGEDELHDDAQALANAQRIVVCVNAMVGIEEPLHFAIMAKNYIQQDEEIRTLINANDNESTIDEVARLKSQRDLLIDVVATIANLTPSTHADKSECTTRVWNKRFLEAFFNSVKSAKQAITKAKGGKNG